ncbi:hypothetical protein D3C83_72130 [compost metagenome]
MNFDWASEPAASRKACGSADHSTCQGPVARSKSVIMASSMAPACWRTILPAARMNSQEIGLRFCGMVLEEPLPFTNGSNTSPSSVDIIIITS